jgi:hypothetical protein
MAFTSAREVDTMGEADSVTSEAKKSPVLLMLALFGAAGSAAWERTRSRWR